MLIFNPTLPVRPARTDQQLLRVRRHCPRQLGRLVDREAGRIFGGGRARACWSWAEGGDGEAWVGGAGALGAAAEGEGEGMETGTSGLR